ncbi:hypothetical protein NECID01_0814 [Nematocida sp. AWRm77]|nr:hypothetical protein NECID01_0814 [Nematocida sp. AWRm77]
MDEKEEHLEEKLQQAVPSEEDLDRKTKEASEEILRDYILQKITKTELEQAIEKKSIGRKEFNLVVLQMLALTQVSAKPEASAESSAKAAGAEVLKLKGAIPESQLLEIKKLVEDSGYITKPYQQYSFFRRTSEDLSAAVSTRPQLISLFSASYNVLCGKTKKILSVKDIQNKMKKGSFEYKLSEHVSVEIAQCAYECLKYYIKHIVESSLNGKNQIDKEALMKIMFGNIRGVYLLYEDYPLGK